MQPLFSDVLIYKIYQKVNNNLTAEVDVNVSTRSSHSAQDVASLTGIKSVQRGTTSAPDGGDTIDVSISSVNLSKTFCSFGYSMVGSDRTACTMYLSSSSNLRLEDTRADANDNVGDIGWEVIEFE